LALGEHTVTLESILAALKSHALFLQAKVLRNSGMVTMTCYTTILNAVVDTTDANQTLQLSAQR
jgi:hypothetical protein